MPMQTCRRHIQYVIMPSNAAETRDTELDNVDKWARANNFTMNRTKCVEIIFHDARRTGDNL